MAQTEVAPKRATKKQAATTKKAPAKRRRGPQTVTDEHKAAMARGREQGNAVRRYLEAMRAVNAPKRRGRRRTPESIRTRLANIDASLREGDLDPVTEVLLIQERIDLNSELDQLESATINPADYEDDFVAAVGEFSERKGISYAAWRELGVRPAILSRGGIRR